MNNHVNLTMVSSHSAPQNITVVQPLKYLKLIEWFSYRTILLQRDPNAHAQSVHTGMAIILPLDWFNLSQFYSIQI